jgi:hypothetical protein
LKSPKGSFLKTPWGERDSIRVGRDAVVITFTAYSESGTEEQGIENWMIESLKPAFVVSDPFRRKKRKG